jgi:hypothetical protein
MMVCMSSAASASSMGAAVSISAVGGTVVAVAAEGVEVCGSATAVTGSGVPLATGWGELATAGSRFAAQAVMNKRVRSMKMKGRLVEVLKLDIVTSLC